MSREIRQAKKVIAKPSFLSKIWKFIKKGYVIATVIFAIIGWIALKDQFHQWFSSKHQKFEEEKFIKGIFIPDTILSKEKTFNIFLGLIKIETNVSEMLSGTAINANRIFRCQDSDENPINLKMQIVNNRLQISASFKYYENESIVGSLQNNHWELVKDNVLNYHDFDNCFEVLDPGGNIVFKIKYESPNSLIYEGYSVGSDYVSVTTTHTFTTCISKKDPYYKQNVLKAVKVIQPYMPF